MKELATLPDKIRKYLDQAPVIRDSIKAIMRCVDFTPFFIEKDWNNLFKRFDKAMDDHRITFENSSLYSCGVLSVTFYISIEVKMEDDCTSVRNTFSKSFHLVEDEFELSDAERIELVKYYYESIFPVIIKTFMEL